MSTLDPEDLELLRPRWWIDGVEEKKAPGPARSALHGTRSAYNWCSKEPGGACGPCRAADAAHSRAKRAARRARRAA